MESLLKQEYFHAGTDHIYKELWLNIQMEQIHQFSKPYGGLWTSHLRIDSNRICDWIDYLDEQNKIQLEHLSYKKSCLVKFKENTKFLDIQTINDFKNLKDSGFIKNIQNPNFSELLDYEKIADYYDLLYVKFGIHPSFKNFSINTMLALNIDSIEYYKPITVDYTNQKITSIGSKKQIAEPNENYYQLVDYITELFNDMEIDYINYNEYVNTLYHNIQKIINMIKEVNPELNIQKDINANFLIKTIVQNIYREKYLQKQKTLKKQV